MTIFTRLEKPAIRESVSCLWLQVEETKLKKFVVHAAEEKYKWKTFSVSLLNFIVTKKN